jgi:hypothetical protein
LLHQTLRHDIPDRVDDLRTYHQSPISCVPNLKLLQRSPAIASLSLARAVSAPAWLKCDEFSNGSVPLRQVANVQDRTILSEKGEIADRLRAVEERSVDGLRDLFFSVRNPSQAQ